MNEEEFPIPGLIRMDVKPKNLPMLHVSRGCRYTPTNESEAKIIDLVLVLANFFTSFLFSHIPRYRLEVFIQHLANNLHKRLKDVDVEVDCFELVVSHQPDEAKRTFHMDECISIAAREAYLNVIELLRRFPRQLSIRLVDGKLWAYRELADQEFEALELWPKDENDEEMSTFNDGDVDQSTALTYGKLRKISSRPFYPHFFDIVPSSEAVRAGYARIDDLAEEDGTPGWTLVFNPRPVPAEQVISSDEEEVDERDPYDLRLRSVQRKICSPQTHELVPTLDFEVKQRDPCFVAHVFMGTRFGSSKQKFHRGHRAFDRFAGACPFTTFSIVPHMRALIMQSTWAKVCSLFAHMPSPDSRFVCRLDDNLEAQSSSRVEKAELSEVSS